MSSKKGEISAEDLWGFLRFVGVSIILILLFFGCNITKATKEYEQLKFSKSEVQAAKELNRFLETPVDQDKKVYDTILGYLKDIYADGDSVKFSERMDELGEGNLPKYRRLMVILPGGGILYDSLGRYTPRDIGYAYISEGVALLPVSKGSNNFDFIEIVLQ